MKNITKLTLFLVLFPFSTVYANNNEFDLFIEVGGLWQHRNDVQVPAATGTRIGFDHFNQGPFLHYRLEGYLRISPKTALRWVYAPAEFEVSGRADEVIVFNGESYSDTEDVTVNYKFNSYRFSYIHSFWGFGDDQLNLGFTAKIRDAQVTFSQPGVSSSYGNNMLGFAPLVYFEYQKPLGENWKFNLTMDAAAAPQGRAIDAAFKFRRSIRKGSSLGLGIRSFEGGAENDKVYSFAWFNYVVLELKIGF
jgi:hypothetical protein